MLFHQFEAHSLIAFFVLRDDFLDRYDLWNVGAAIGNSSAGGNFGMGSVAHALPAYPSAYGNIPSPGSNQAHMQQGAYGYAWGVVGSGVSPMGQPFYPNQQHGGGSNSSHE